MTDHAKNVLFNLLLNWLRTDDSDYAEGYTAGYLCAKGHELDPWQRAYLNNIRSARYRGISA